MTSLTENSSSSSGLSLAVRLQRNSAEAWKDLVELYGPLVESWASRAGLSGSSCEDIVQDVFLSVHRSIDRFDATRAGATFRGWLWRITRNAVLHSVRRPEPPPRGGSTALAQMGEVVDPWGELPEDDPPSTVDDTAALLKRALAQIQSRVEPSTWQAFWHTTVLGQRTGDVAQSLKMTPAAVRKARSRTLQRLRQQLGDQP